MTGILVLAALLAVLIMLDIRRTGPWDPWGELDRYLP